MYKSITTAVAVLALAGAGTAFAQAPASGSAQSAHKSAMHGSMHHSHGQRMQKRLAKLKARLKITSAQAAAWVAFSKAAEDMRPGMNSKMKHQSSSRTAPEVFDGMARRAEHRAVKAKALAQAADHLYGQLSSEQKAAWNQDIAEMHAKMHRHWQKHHETSHSMHGSAGRQS